MRDVINAIIGYNDAQEDNLKLLYNVQRFGSLLEINCSGKLKKTLKYQDVPFDWDAPTVIDKEEWKVISEECDRLFLKGHSKKSWNKRGKADVIKERGKRLWGQ